MIDDLLQVHQGNKKKDDVFSAQKEFYDDCLKKASEYSTLITAANDVISKTWPEFTKLK